MSVSVPSFTPSVLSGSVQAPSWQIVLAQSAPTLHSAPFPPPRTVPSGAKTHGGFLHVPPGPPLLLPSPTRSGSAFRSLKVVQLTAPRTSPPPTSSGASMREFIPIHRTSSRQGGKCR